MEWEHVGSTLQLVANSSTLPHLTLVPLRNQAPYKGEEFEPRLPTTAYLPVKGSIRNLKKHVANTRLHVTPPPELSEEIVSDIAPTLRHIVMKNDILWDIVRAKAPSPEWLPAESAALRDAATISRGPAYTDDSDAERVSSLRPVQQSCWRTSQPHLEQIAPRHPDYE